MIGRVFFIIFALFVSLSLLLSAPLYAQERATPSASTYVLPYPGLMPDHPLYWLKIARDSVFGFFISGPVRKAEFDLLQADKRIEASYLLAVKHKKPELVDSTFSKGENYYESALMHVAAGKKQGKDIHDITKKLQEAGKKHIERAENIIDELPEANKKEFKAELKRAQDLGKKANAIKP